MGSATSEKGKTMSRELIYRDDAIRIVAEQGMYEHDAEYSSGTSDEILKEYIEWATEFFEDVPTVDAIERKRGEWMPIIEANQFGEAYQAGIYCSECGETLGCEANFCPCCGADMRGDNNE